MHKVTIKEWQKLNQRERIEVLMQRANISYNEAWEICDVKRPSDLPWELIPLEVEEWPPVVMETVEVDFKLKDYEKLKKAKGDMSWHDFILKMGRKCEN
jgi:hypothetical protein